MLKHFAGSIVLVIFATSASLHAQVRPLDGHPGNVFINGEDVSVALPAGQEPKWRAIDYDAKIVAEGSERQGHADLGKLAPGYYEVRRLGSGERTTLGVLWPRVAPVPVDSPISLDVGMAWFYKDAPTQRTAINLCQLAGVNWVRDRLSWPEMETAPGKFVTRNHYDETADIQSAAGLKILQVNHIEPSWQTDVPSRFPTDLRDAYRFYREMAKRWNGKVLAFEPWNEADIKPFGLHSGVEIASMQKASYLGLKAGNPGVIACMNVLAHDDPKILADFAANEPWAYMDTYNFHTYPGIKDYPTIYAHHRAISGGKPLWVTECNVPIHWSGDEAKKEPSDAELRVGALRVGRIYSAALYEGANQIFFFVFGDYVERQIQYGLVHKDLTPRPSYVAYATVGRFLSGAKPLGRLRDDQMQGYAFEAWPDGKKANVIVAWAREGKHDAHLDIETEAVFDCVGRPMKEIRTNESPVFAIISPENLKKLKLQSPPKNSPPVDGRTCPVVLQATGPQTIVAYNFGDHVAHGSLKFTAPAGWQVTGPSDLEIAPGERKEIALQVVTRAETAAQPMRIDGDFGADGRAVLSMRKPADSTK